MSLLRLPLLILLCSSLTPSQHCTLSNLCRGLPCTASRRGRGRVHRNGVGLCRQRRLLVQEVHKTQCCSVLAVCGLTWMHTSAWWWNSTQREKTERGGGGNTTQERSAYTRRRRQTGSELNMSTHGVAHLYRQSSSLPPSRKSFLCRRTSDRSSSVLHIVCLARFLPSLLLLHNRSGCASPVGHLLDAIPQQLGGEHKQKKYGD